MPRRSSHTSVRRRRGGGSRSRKLLARARNGAKKSRGGAPVTLTVTGEGSILLEKGKHYTLSMVGSSAASQPAVPNQRARSMTVSQSEGSATAMHVLQQHDYIIKFISCEDDGINSKQINMTINGQPVGAQLINTSILRGVNPSTKDYILSITTAENYYAQLAKKMTNEYQVILKELFDNGIDSAQELSFSLTRP